MIVDNRKASLNVQDWDVPRRLSDCCLSDWRLTDWRLTDWLLTDWRLTDWSLTDWSLSDWRLTDTRCGLRHNFLVIQACFLCFKEPRHLLLLLI